MTDTMCDYHEAGGVLACDAAGCPGRVGAAGAEVVTHCICGQLPAPERSETTELVSRPTDDPLYDESVQQELEARAYAGPACILTGAPGESDDDCTTHEHEPITRACEDCGAEPGEDCRPDCLGQAAHLDEIAPTCEECGARTDALVSDEHDAACSLYSGNVTGPAPYCTPEECDHQGAPAGHCSQCCPCAECAAMRSQESGAAPQ